MEKEVKIGKETELELALKDGKVVLSINADFKGVDVGLSVALEPEYFVGKLTKAIPGQADDALAALLLAALKKA